MAPFADYLLDPTAAVFELVDRGRIARLFDHVPGTESPQQVLVRLY